MVRFFVKARPFQGLRHFAGLERRQPLTHSTFKRDSDLLFYRVKDQLLVRRDGQPVFPQTLQIGANGILSHRARLRECIALRHKTWKGRTSDNVPAFFGGLK